MDALYLFLALVVVNLLQPNSFALAKPQPQIAPRANAILIPHEKDVSKVTRLGWTSTITALTFFTPSPSADPIPITSQGQTVTSHVPILTICPFVSSIPSLPSLAVNTSFPATTASLATAASGYASDGSALYRRQVAAATDTPYTNASVPTSYLSSCSVSYTPTTTQICHSTLTPLASPAITITDCIQQVTFSTDHGYTIVPGNKTSSIIDLTSYYAARWDVIENGLPTGQGIRKEVCSTGTIAGCSSVWEAWLPSTGWVPEVSTYTVGPPVSVTGPAIVIIHPSLPTMTIPPDQTSPISISTTFPAPTGRATIGIHRTPTITDGGAAATSVPSGNADDADGSNGTEDGDTENDGTDDGEESTTTSTHTNTMTRVVTVQRAWGTGT